MSNPTLGNSQFRAPFNILPDVKLPNPTRPASGQFKSPYDILPNIKYSSPLIDGVRRNQFNPQLQMGNQVTFNLLPDPKLFNPTTFQTQFNKPQTLGSFQTFDIADVPDPAIPLLTPYTKPPIVYLPGDALPIQYLTNWYYSAEDNARYRFNTTAQNTSTNIVNITTAVAQQFGLTQNLSFTPNFTFTTEGNQFATPYNTLLFSQLTNNLTQDAISAFANLLDFRSRLNPDKPNRNDGKSVAQGFRASDKAQLYFQAATSEAGAYSVINLSAPGKNGYGWGEHDAPGADRSDFTQNTEVSTKWNAATSEWERSVESAAIPFRGDKVNVIDFKKSRRIDQAYVWKPNSILGAIDPLVGQLPNATNSTQDFIKFFFTGPKLQNGLVDAQDDIMVFRAAITALDDSFNANWNPVQFIGRADPNYHYTGYSRDLSLGFDVYATTRDELKFIWRKLNALAGYTAPEYNKEDIALRAPWMRITIGDLFIQQPVVMNSLNYSYATDTSWEINIEDDPTNMQVPFKISVTTQFNLITDFLPQKNGKFFSLAKQYNANSTPLSGNDNWLSDFDRPLLPVGNFSQGEFETENE